MRAYAKTVVRTVKDNLARFLAITFVALLGVAFVSGLGALSPIFRDTISEYVTEGGGADITVKSLSENGFSSEEQESILALESVDSVSAFSSFDSASGALYCEIGEAEARVRLVYRDLSETAVGQIKVQKGRLPESAKEVLIDRVKNKATAASMGDEISLSVFNSMMSQYTVVGIAENPIMFAREGEPDAEEEPLDVIIYMHAPVTNLTLTMATPSGFVNVPLPTTDMYVRLSGVEGLNIFSSKYEKRVAAAATQIETVGEVKCLTADDNYSLILTNNYADKVTVISLIFPLFFIAVAALVVLTTMTRMVEEERGVIGCYKTLGYGNSRIAFKYVGFSLGCCLLGSLVGIFGGVWLLPAVIFPAFDSLLFFPSLVVNLHITMGVVSAITIAVVVAAVTAYVVLRALKIKPAQLLRPKSPKPGKKIFLERIPLIWNRLKFRYKSTLRNIFRYAGHLIMTVISVAGSTALVLAGFGLGDASRNPDASKIAGFEETFSMISFVIILFAAALCVLVIYNLTNMNIGERKREIATLKVLGYRDLEVSGYIYREVLIMAILGILVGLPLGFGLLHFVFEYLDIGSTSMVKWYSYIFSAALVLLFVGFVDLLLHRKIRKINMIDSLKSVE